jgi:hypothetical protein
MPGTMFELDFDEALAIAAMIAVDPAFPEWCSDAERQAFQAEARRVVEHAAHEAAVRCLVPPRAQPSLKVVKRQT